MKNPFFLLLLSGFMVQVYGQTADTLEVKSGRVTLQLGSVPVRFKIAPTGNQIVLSDSLLPLFASGKLTSHSVQPDTVGNEVRLQLVLPTVQVGKLKLTDVPAIAQFQLSGLDATEESVLGLRALSKLLDCQLKGNGLMVALKQPKPLANNHIKLVPCFEDSIFAVKTMRLAKFFTSELPVGKLEEEKHFPLPVNATKRLKSGFTVRYFAPEDAQTAQFVSQELGFLYPSDSCRTQDMTPWFKTPIPRYLEIWIR